jgi:hypothetical protein
MTGKKEKPKRVRTTINATLSMKPEDWELLLVKAKALGMSRTQLVTRLARGEIQTDTLRLSEERYLGESCAN